MAAKINTLIDKQDNFEVIRDKIALILAEEEVEQKVLAVAASKDPALWAFNVFIERAIPWQLLENIDGKIISETPLVNVYYDSGNFIKSKSDIVKRQNEDGSFFIDIYAAKNSLNESGIITPGDLRTSLEVDRLIKLVRNILMSAFYTYLDLQGIVWQRWIQEIRKFQPAIEDRPAEHVMAARVNLQVSFNEFSPQEAGVDLEEINIELNTDSGGQVILNYDLT